MQILECGGSWNETAAGFCSVLFLATQGGSSAYGIDQKEIIKLVFLSWSVIWIDLGSCPSSSSYQLYNWHTCLKMILNSPSVNEELDQLSISLFHNLIHFPKSLIHFNIPHSQEIILTSPSTLLDPLVIFQHDLLQLPPLPSLFSFSLMSEKKKCLTPSF